MNLKRFFTKRIQRYLIKQKIKDQIKEANFQHLTTGKKYFVIPLAGGKYGVVHSSFLPYFNTELTKAGKKKIDYQDLVKMSIYQTK